jgi:uncharacterized protein YhfF
LRRRLVDAVLRGEKTATASLRSSYEPFATEPLPWAGERCALVGYADEPLGVVQVTQVSVVALDEVDLQFALDEGEGFTSVSEWQTAHLEYWAAEGANENTLVVCERFRLLQSLEPGQCSTDQVAHGEGEDQAQQAADQEVLGE